MRNILFATTVALGLATTLSFAEIPPKPTQCPSVNVLKDFRFPIIQQTGNHEYYLATYPDLFGTDYKYNWILTTQLNVKKENPQALAFEGLKTLAFLSGPSLIDNRWTCTYINADKQVYNAYSPII